MQWQQRLNYMSSKQSGVPSAGSTGNVAYAPGMMTIYGGGPGANSVPTARQMSGPQQMMEKRNWAQRAKEMPTTNGVPGSAGSSTSMTMGTGGSRPSGGMQGAGVGPMISPDIMQRIMQAIDADSKPRY
jgi:hypothetical protein